MRIVTVRLRQRDLPLLKGIPAYMCPGTEKGRHKEREINTELESTNFLSRPLFLFLHFLLPFYSSALSTK